MAYATYTDVSTYARARGLAELAQETGASLTADGQTRVTGEIEAAGYFMDGFLQAKHDVPITSPTSAMNILKAHCCRLVTRALFADRLMAPEFVRTEAEETVKWLEGIQKTGLAGVEARTSTELTEQSIDAESGEQLFGLADAFL